MWTRILPEDRTQLAISIKAWNEALAKAYKMINQVCKLPLDAENVRVAEGNWIPKLLPIFTDVKTTTENVTKIRLTLPNHEQTATILQVLWAEFCMFNNTMASYGLLGLQQALDHWHESAMLELYPKAGKLDRDNGWQFVKKVGEGAFGAAHIFAKVDGKGFVTDVSLDSQTSNETTRTYKNAKLILFPSFRRE